MAPNRRRERQSLVSGGRRGVFGLSSGLFYVPGTFTSTDEVIELAKVAARFSRIYISHMRDEASRVFDSVEETITIGERGGLPAQLPRLRNRCIGGDESPLH